MTLRADTMRDRRRVFAAPGGSHDRTVRILAVVLPASIGALLAVMVLAPLSPRGEISFLLDRTKVAMVDDRMRALGAMYRGQDDRGRGFSVKAGSAVQHSAAVHQVVMNDVTARMMLDDGPAIMDAQAGTYDFSRQEIDVPGAVNVQTADGYRMVTQGATIKLDQRGTETEAEFGSIVLATGFKLFPADAKPQYGFGRYKNVITGMQMDTAWPCIARRQTRLVSRSAS